MTEYELIERVKSAQDSAALVDLVNQHTGAYFSVVNRYASAYPGVIRADDMGDDKLLNFYTFICAYDPAKGTKLSTFITQRTDYLCKTMLKRGRHNPLDGCGLGSTGVMPITETGELGESSAVDGLRPLNLPDTSRVAQVSAEAESHLDSDMLMQAANNSCPDKRFGRIFSLRHHDGLSWREIGKKMKLSHERARNLYMEHVGAVVEGAREAV
jgi:DNA-directed RNA polymerase specialized sigma24 family protein